MLYIIVEGALDIHLLSKWFDMKESTKSYHKNALLRVQRIGGIFHYFFVMHKNI